MAQSTPNLDYQDFDPFYEWSEDEASATLTVMLPGFTKEQLKVRVTSTPVLMINGERHVFENKRRRFAREFSIPPYCDTNEVSAKFEGGVLTIKFPKLITPAYNNKPQPQKSPTPQKEEELQQDQVDNNKQESPQKENEPKPISDDKGKDNKAEEELVQPNKEVAPKKVKTSEVSSDTAQERPKAKLTQRLKTRVLDFTVSLKSSEEPLVKLGSCGNNKYAKLIKRPKIWMNIIVIILLVMVLGLYVKNAFSSSHLGGSKFQEF